MASKEAELKELAELEELAQLEALAAKEAAPTPEEPGVLDYAMRGLNYVGGLGRGTVAAAVEPLVGKDIVSPEEIMTGKVPGSAELMERAGVPAGWSLSTAIPAAFSETGEGLPLEKGGMFDITARGFGGLVGDIALDPSTYVLPMVKGTGMVAKGLRAGLNPLGEAISASSKLASKVVPSKYSLMSAVSGVPKEAIETYSRNKNLIDNLDVQAAEELAQGASEQAKNAVMQVRRNAGLALSQAAEEAGNKKIDIVKLKKALNKIVTPPQGALENKAAKATYKEMQDTISQLLKTTGKTAERLELSEEGIITKIPEMVGEVSIPDTLSASQLFELKQQIKDMGDLYGGKGGLLSKLASQNAPLVNKEFTANLTGVVKQIDNMIDVATEGASKEARSEYAKLSTQARAADRYFSTPEKTFGTLSNLSTNAKAPARRIIKNVDQSFKTNLEQTGKVIEAAKYFNEPSIEALSGKGTTSTSRTLGGAAVGSGLGSLLGGPAGAAIGAAIGSKAASPSAIKNIYLPATELASKASSFIPNAPSNIPPQVWLEMLRKKESEQ